ncbi:MAG TPA: magnesium transporter CorA family protein [Hyphomicrobiales bacterium]|nr:magnesium transporter CorA family protein [Hyphomicrobiales bacterium]
MLSIYAGGASRLTRLTAALDAPVPESAIWLDLLNPTPEEEKLVEQRMGVGIPTREEMQEIEVSSRLYVEGGARYMTATVLANADTAPKLTNVTFILSEKRLVTVRYDEPRAIEAYVVRACKGLPGPAATLNGATVMLGLLEAVIDRAADVLEKIGAEIDETSSWIFERQSTTAGPNRRYVAVLRTLGRKGDLLSKSRESLVTIGRLVGFLNTEFDGQKLAADIRSQLRTVGRDAQALSDHSFYLSSKVSFLLDATLGMVSIEQNDIIKLFSVVSVMLMPPTLIASIYGMNFHTMPELSWSFGYPYALGAMALSALLPFLFFRWKKWL